LKIVFLLSLIVKTYDLKRIVVSVTSDLVTDQRVDKICNTLVSMDYEVLLIGRKLPNSLPLKRNYKTNRMSLLFNKGFLFYAEYNTRLFFKLLFLRKDILLANDLDTLLPNFLISKSFNKKLVYDSHEFFTESEGLTNRPIIKKTWLIIEKFIFPKLKNVYTVNKKIANIYNNKYRVKVQTVRNIAPTLLNKTIDKNLSNTIKGSNKMIILQGTGLNADRGAEEAIEMMQYLDKMVLYIIGDGDIFQEFKNKVKSFNLNDKVFIIDKLPYEELMEYTKIADLGLSLDKGTNLNYENSLPNKVFDYIQAQIPLLVSNRKLVQELVYNNNIGRVVNHHDPKKLALEVVDIFKNENQYDVWKTNLIKASKKYCWEKERLKVKEIFRNIK
jgi:glycosyltransferase involved in cell wall biosynthesis